MKVSISDLIGKDIENPKNKLISKSGQNVIKNQHKGRIINRAQKYTSYKKVTINKKCDSCRVKELKFNNHLKAVNNDKYCSAIINIFDYDGKSIDNDKLPIRLDEATLEADNRHKIILGKMGYNYDFINDVIHKSPYLDKMSQICHSFAHSGEDIRIYYKYHIESNLIEIILIDLYHLFATSIYDAYSKVSSYNIKISSIISNRI